MPDDTLQRTLLLAQKFVDETKADSEAQASRIVADAEAKARLVTEQAQTQASQMAAESEQRLREEIARLEESRGRLSHEVETMNRHLEGERSRLRTALSEILRWVDENVQPGTSSQPSRPGPERRRLAERPGSGRRRAGRQPAGRGAPQCAGPGRQRHRFLRRRDPHAPGRRDQRPGRHQRTPGPLNAPGHRPLARPPNGRPGLRY